jgi:hypothetical protein
MLARRRCQSVRYRMLTPPALALSPSTSSISCERLRPSLSRSPDAQAVAAQHQKAFRTSAASSDSALQVRGRRLSPAVNFGPNCGCLRPSGAALELSDIYVMTQSDTQLGATAVPVLRTGHDETHGRQQGPRADSKRRRTDTGVVALGNENEGRHRHQLGRRGTGSLCLHPCHADRVRTGHNHRRPRSPRRRGADVLQLEADTRQDAR